MKQLDIQLPINNYYNKRFGRLLVITPKMIKQRRYWLCRCECGKEKYIRHTHLRSGQVHSCGCLKKDMLQKRNKFYCGQKSYLYKHGLSQTIEYQKNLLLQRRYNITLSDYNSLFKKQKGACAICHKQNIKLAIDHNHLNNKVRGLVCYTCNALLGAFDTVLKIKKNRYLYLKINQYIKKGNI